MAEVQERPGRTHCTEGPGRDDIDLFERPFLSQLGNNGRHLLCSDDPCRPVTDAFIDLPDGFVHTRIFRFPNI